MRKLLKMYLPRWINFPLRPISSEKCFLKNSSISRGPYNFTNFNMAALWGYMVKSTKLSGNPCSFVKFSDQSMRKLLSPKEPNSMQKSKLLWKWLSAYIVAGHLTWGSVITVAWGREGGEKRRDSEPWGDWTPLCWREPPTCAIRSHRICNRHKWRFKLLRTIHYSSVRQATATGERPYPGPRQYIGCKILGGLEFYLDLPNIEKLGYQNSPTRTLTKAQKSP